MQISSEESKMPNKVKDKGGINTLEGETPRKVLAKRERRTKYHLLRKDKTSKDYERIRLFVDGEEKKLSDSSKFLLEQLIENEEL